MNHDVLIIGGSGFVGLGVVRHFLQLGRTVSVLNRGTHPVAGTQQLIADRDDLASMRGVLKNHHFDLVVDCSGLTERHVQFAVEALAGRTNRWIHISSASVYAPSIEVPIPEVHPATAHPIWGQYGVDKAKADAWLLNSPIADQLTILRPPYIFGAGNNVDREQFIWRRLFASRPILLPGSGETSVQFVHIDDLAIAVELAASRSTTNLSAVYNVGNSRATILHGLVELLADIADRTLEIVNVPLGMLGYAPREYFPFRDVTCFLDTTLITQDLDWRPIDLRSRFSETFTTFARSDLTEQETEVEDQLLKALKISW